VAHELRHRCDLQLRDVPFGLQDFVDRMAHQRRVCDHRRGGGRPIDKEIRRDGNPGGTIIGGVNLI
jgi:hypothetical protein